MLKKIYRAIVLAQTASAAVKVVACMTDAQLSDVGIIRSQFPVEAMKVIEAEFARKDIESLENMGQNEKIAVIMFFPQLLIQRPSNLI